MMAVREDLIASAVTFLQDPSVSASPIENRIAFLQSKNLTKEEVDVALARASGEAAPANFGNYAPQQQVVRQPYGGYQQYQWQQPPPELPKRDWRDYFIMATVMGGVGYGLYVVAKRYVLPLIAPPTPPQLEQDKASVDASFTKAFNLLDQLSKDTETLRASETERTDRLDKALSEVETVITDLKTSSRRREEESRTIKDEVGELKKLIPQAMEGQKENMDARLKELNTELKSLKMLMGQRMGVVTGSGPATNGASSSSAPAPVTPGATSESTTSKATTATGASTINGSVSDSTNATSSGRTLGASSNGASPFMPSIPLGRGAIPAWQMNASKKTAQPAKVSAADSQPDLLAESMESS